MRSTTRCERRGARSPPSHARRRARAGGEVFALYSIISTSFSRVITYYIGRAGGGGRRRAAAGGGRCPPPRRAASVRREARDAEGRSASRRSHPSCAPPSRQLRRELVHVGLRAAVDRADTLAARERREAAVGAHLRVDARGQSRTARARRPRSERPRMRRRRTSLAGQGGTLQGCRSPPSR